jgi:SAM-dependent methyltransferase
MKHDPDGVTLSHLLKVPGVKDREVLEIGCGDGRITRGLVPHVKRLVAVDPDAEALEKARVRIPRAEFHQGSGEALAFPDRSFDAVLFTMSLHHQHAEKALSNAARVIRENGTILVLEPVVGTDIERVCRPLDDERYALLASLYAVLEGSWTIRRKVFFDVRWVFEDRDELIQWVFDYYGAPAREEQASLMNGILGEKAGNRPLVVGDRLMLLALAP